MHGSRRCFAHRLVSVVTSAYTPTRSSAGENAGVTWQLVDQSGNVRDVVASNGSLVDHIDYGAFGQVHETNPGTLGRFGYAGMQFVSALGLYYDNARWFDPAGGRFLTPDPAQTGPNPYEYVGNNTPNATDPSGLMELGSQGSGADLLGQLVLGAPGDQYQRGLEEPLHGRSIRICLPWTKRDGFLNTVQKLESAQS